MLHITALFEEFNFSNQARRSDEKNTQEKDLKREGFSTATKLLGTAGGAHMGSKITRNIYSTFSGDNIDKDNYVHAHMVGLVLGGLAGRSAGNTSGTYVYDKFYKKNKKD